MSTPPGQTPRGPTSGLAWSAFLGCSWTWCIGMFLPVLLVRDFGIAGFLVFAIPNILGAAAMAWLLPDADASRRFVEKHARLCASFSVVTIAFHVFFVIWMIQRQIMVPAAVPVILALAVAMLVTVASNRGAVVAAWAVLTVSLAAFAAAAIHLPSAVAALHFTGPVPPINLLGLAAVCVFGFSLCPYLDLTFHRARQNTSRSQGKIAFAGGSVCHSPDQPAHVGANRLHTRRPSPQPRGKLVAGDSPRNPRRYYSGVGGSAGSQLW